MNADITVVVPYYNETRTIESTLEKIGKQTLSAKHAIFVNSSSTDNTSDILDKWIEKNQHRFTTKFKNIFENTSNPSSSKNVGIRYANTEWLAFMDCGQKFDIDWLEKQFNFAKENNVDVVFGVVYLSGVNWIDRCAVAQTYGYKRNRPCVPSTLVRKTIFDKTGLFLEGRRSGYDLAWRIKVKNSGVKYGINSNCKIIYRGANFSPSISQLLNKSILYARHSVGLDGYYVPYIHIFLGLLFLIILFVSPEWAFILFLIYILVKTIVIPVIKSQNLLFYKEHIFEALLGSWIIGCIFDTGKLVGYFIGVRDYFK